MTGDNSSAKETLCSKVYLGMDNIAGELEFVYHIAYSRPM